MDLVDISVKQGVKALVMIDDHTNFGTIKVVSNKESGVVHSACESAWANKFGWPKGIRTERGGEFFKVWESARDRGSEIQKTAAGAPWSDGRSERYNRTLLETLRRVSVGITRLEGHKGCHHSLGPDSHTIHDQ